MKKNVILLFLAIVFFGTASAQVPGTISYQGFYSDEKNNPVDGGPYKITFAFFDEKGTTEIKDLAREVEDITINKGVISVIIGGGDTKHKSGPDNKQLPVDIWNQAYQIQVSVNDKPIGGLVPLTTVPYAFLAGRVDGNNITGEISANKISGVLDGSKVGQNINATNITTGVLNGSLLDIGSVSGTKLKSDLDASQIASGTLSISSVNTSGKITTAGGVHVGGTSDPGAGNLTVEGIITGDGSGISSVSAASLTGTVLNERLEPTVEINALNAGSGGQFAINSAGNITKINNLNYSFPSSYTAATTNFLANNGSGTLTWVTVLPGSMLDPEINDLADGTLGALNIGSSSQFVVSSSGNLTKINNITYSFPSSQGGAGSLLRNDGSGNLIWTNSNFNWDNVNSRLGIGGTPATPLHITGNNELARLQGTDRSVIAFYPDGASGPEGTLGFAGSTDDNFSLVNASLTGKIQIRNQNDGTSPDSGTGAGSIEIGNNILCEGDNSIIIGSYGRLMPDADGSMFLTDNSTTSISLLKTIPNRFYARFSSGYFLYTNSGESAGVGVSAGGTSWSAISDSTKKENFIPTDGEAILQKISKLRLDTWNYKFNDSTIRHYGPMAQDFFAAFGFDGIGYIGNDTTIATQDIEGLSLTAIKALILRTDQLKNAQHEITTYHAQLNDQWKEMQNLKQQINITQSELHSIDKLKKENEELRNEIENIKQLLNIQANQNKPKPKH